MDHLADDGADVVDPVEPFQLEFVAQVFWILLTQSQTHAVLFCLARAGHCWGVCADVVVPVLLALKLVQQLMLVQLQE